jgi:cytochrome c-type biogenesis protein CcmH/NrfG
VPPLSLLALLIFAISSLCAAQSTEARSHAGRGLELAQSGDLASAESELRQAVKLEPNNPEFLSTLATLLAMEKKLDESTTFFRKAVQLVPSDVKSRRYLAANLWQLHRYAEAKHELETILREHPDDAQSRLLLGMVSENSGDYATAAKMLSSVPDEVGKRPESLAALARSYYRLRQQANARTTLQRFTSQSTPKATLLAAGIADQAGDYEEAERLLDSISSSGADAPDIQFRKANVQYHAGHFAQCQTTLGPLLAGSGATAQMYNLMGWCYHRLKKPKEATEAFEHAISLAPADESNYLDLIKVLEAHYFLRVALDAANRGVALFPKSVAMLNRKGSIESRMYHFNDAVISYRQAIQLQDTNVESWLGLARAQISAESIADATSTLKSALERFPNEASLKVIYARMLTTHDDTGDHTPTRRAEQLLRQAVTNDPANPEAFFELGKIELNDGKVNQACQHLERAVKLSPQISEPHFVLWHAYQRLNRPADAARELETFQRLKKNPPAEPQEGSSSTQVQP